jgi:hypothetical protein
LYEGRCHQDAGDLGAALTAYNELLEMTAMQSPFFVLKTQAFKAALECWLDDSRKEYAQAVGAGESWLKGADVTDLRDQDAIEAVELLAGVYRAFADSLTDDDAQAARYRQRASELQNQAAALRESRAGEGQDVTGDQP